MEKNTSKIYVEPAALPCEPPDATNDVGSPLFVINLCASQAPNPQAGQPLPGLESYRLYQVSRIEDGRTRYRLRLGFFTSEEDANDVLATVRANFATAFTACLADEDRRFARGYLPETAPVARPRPVAVVTPATAVAKAATPAPVSAPAVAAKPAPAKLPAPVVAAPVPAQAAVAPRPAVTDTQSRQKITVEASAAIEMTWEPEAPPMHAAQAGATQATSTGSHKTCDASSIDDIELTWDPPLLPAAPPAAPVIPAVSKTEPVAKDKPLEKPAQPVVSKPAAPVTLELELESEPVAAKQPTPAIATPSQPFHVGKGVDIPNVSLSLQAEAASVVAPSAPAIAASATKPAAAKQAAAPAPQAHPTTGKLPARVAALPDLDSTQTIRALTGDELNDSAAEKWFAIQLAVSEQPVNLDAMPHLDIFEAYRLYSVANAGSGKIMHALRLGFFREAVSAEAVAGYLKTFFAATSVLRISSAEHLRFKDPPAPKAPAPAEIRNDKIVDLNQARDRAARPTIPTVTMEVVPQHGGAETDRSPTGAFNTGSHAARVPSNRSSGTTGKHKALNPTLKPAAKHAGPATKHSAPLKSNGSTTGRYRAPPKMSLQQQLLEEAREVALSESGIRRLPKSDSLLSRLVDKLKK